VAGSALLAALLEIIGLPAALLLGPMIAGILIEAGGGTVRVSRSLHYGAQAVIGCMVARAITPDIVHTFLGRWPLFIGVVFAAIFACSVLGWLMSRWKIMPGTTAIWGLSPGAAGVMMLMAEAYGADARLVAFMQYLRVVAVAFSASLVAWLWFGASAAATTTTVWFAPIHWASFAETLVLIVVGGVLGRVSRIPAGGVLVPLIAGAVLHGSGVMEIELPQWLRAASYALLGWNIGLGFTRPILAHAARTLPQTLLAILSLILFCGGLAFALVKAAGVAPLTAYLATSPGGIDSIAIIAASSKVTVDLSFIMALQLARLVVVLALGPHISRFVANRMRGAPANEGIALQPPTDAGSDETLRARVKEDEGELD
jgi:membrane AbrB-like protein